MSLGLRRYQKGYVYKTGKKIKTWYGMFRVDLKRPDGSIIRRQHNVKLGTVAELPTKAAAREALAHHIGDLQPTTTTLKFSELIRSHRRSSRLLRFQSFALAAECGSAVRRSRPERPIDIAAWPSPVDNVLRHLVGELRYFCSYLTQRGNPSVARDQPRSLHTLAENGCWWPQKSWPVRYPDQGLGNGPSDPQSCHSIKTKTGSGDLRSIDTIAPVCFTDQDSFRIVPWDTPGYQENGPRNLPAEAVGYGNRADFWGPASPKSCLRIDARNSLYSCILKPAWFFLWDSKCRACS